MELKLLTKNNDMLPIIISFTHYERSDLTLSKTLDYALYTIQVDKTGIYIVYKL